MKHLLPPTAFRLAPLLFIAALLCACAGNAGIQPAASATDAEETGSFVVGGAFPVPMFRLHGDDPLPACTAELNGATVLTANGVYCVCKTSSRGGSWLSAGAGTACEPQNRE